MKRKPINTINLLMRNTIREPEPVTVTIGPNNDVALSFTKRKHVVTAKALRVTRDEQGEPIHIVLDRLVHEDHQKQLGDFIASGCVVSELTRIHQEKAV